MKIFIKFAVVGLIFLFQASVQAADYYVNVNNSTPGSGTSWSTAFDTIQGGIDAASSAGGEVWVAKGTYYVYSTSNADTLEMKSGADLYGGFDGTETSRDQRDWNANETVIDGHQSAGSGNQVQHVVTGSDNATIDGFTITGGKARSGGGQPPKRGNRPRATSPDEIFESGGGGSGGGMLIFRTNPTVSNCTFTGNSAGKGGAVYVMVATEYPTQTPNDAPTFTDCVFSDNSASSRGGGVSNDVATHPTFIGCTFVSNTCDAKGGAMYNDFGCSPTLINCLFAKNTAHRATAMGCDGSSSPKLVNCTVTDNYAYDVGSGIYTGSYLAGANEPTLVNCIVWGNENQWGGPTDFNVWHENHFYISYSLIGQGFTSYGEGVIQEDGADPLFVNPDNGDYRLQAGSPCINTGTNSDGDVPDTDLDGESRSGNADMGAYEYTGIIETGSLQVTIEPQGAIDAGAQWKADSGDWQDSGATVSDLSAGEHTVSFGTVKGWTTPTSAAVTIIAGETAPVTGTYAPIQGDMDGDGFLTLADLIIVLRICAGEEVLPETALSVADVNDDDRIGPTEAVYILWKVSGMR